MSEPESPFPITGTITPTDYGYSASLSDVTEHLTEAEHDYLQMAVDRAARKYGEGVEVRVRFYGGRYEPEGYELLGPVDEAAGDAQ